MSGGPEPRGPDRPGRMGAGGAIAPVAAAGGQPHLGRWVALVVVAIALAIAKPWAGLEPPAAGSSRRRPPPPRPRHRSRRRARTRPARSSPRSAPIRRAGWSPRPNTGAARRSGSGVRWIRSPPRTARTTRRSRSSRSCPRPSTCSAGAPRWWARTARSIRHSSRCGCGPRTGPCRCAWSGATARGAVRVRGDVRPTAGGRRGRWTLRGSKRGGQPDPERASGRLGSRPVRLPLQARGQLRPLVRHRHRDPAPGPALIFVTTRFDRPAKRAAWGVQAKAPASEGVSALASA